MGNKTSKGTVVYTEYKNVFVEYDDGKVLPLDFVNSDYFTFSVKDLFENGQEIEFRFTKDYERNYLIAIVELSNCPLWYRIKNFKRYIELNNKTIDELLNKNKLFEIEIKKLSDTL